ncbi:hypothetical protein [Dethiothermospora halolimnae]|uniref:hypothetical protein n=1 Tax=Dethiothermospora halolimnae TaxID=3114390 RepID=UPI003CCC300E
MTKPIKIKKTPKLSDIDKEVLKKFINTEDKTITLTLDKISPIQDLYIKLFYYKYIKYIYHIGRGRVFYQQLSDYMEKVHGEAPRRTREMVKEMEKYKLINKEMYWNKSIIELTRASQLAIGKKISLRRDIGSLTRSTFIVEHYNTFYPDKRQQFISFVENNKFLLGEDCLEEFKNHNIFLEKVSRNNRDEYMLTFTLFDVNSNIDPNKIVEKIELINSNINKENVFFSLNICSYDIENYEFISLKWLKEYNTPYLSKQTKEDLKDTIKKINEIEIKREEKYINCSSFKFIKFTNLNIKKFFSHSRSKY